MIICAIICLAGLLFLGSAYANEKNVEQGPYALTSITLVFVEFIPQNFPLSWVFRDIL